MLGRTTYDRIADQTQCVYRSLGGSSPEQGFTFCSANKPFSESIGIFNTAAPWLVPISSN
ncbi:MAG: hypothetical protein C4K47_03400 [Candidatus Thorarchaeota archaeon]|nr:MAG: hypothetical protein C4K47_03400 [Candidatus Thorarchaeota archaeon]